MIKYRGFIWQQAVADLRHRYAGTGMGLAWNVIHPLGVIAVYSIVFSSIMKISMPNQSGHLAYVIYLCSGLFPWLAFTECITRGCASFVSNAQYLKRLSIPEIVFVMQNAAATGLSLAINFALLLVLTMLLGAKPIWTWLILPAPLFFLLLLGFSIGFLLATLNAFFRDISEWVTVLLPIIMWTVPIVYLPGILPKGMKAALPWHPIAPSLAAVRELFLDGRMPETSLWIGMTIWPILILIVATYAFRKLGPEIRDLI